MTFDEFCALALITPEEREVLVRYLALLRYEEETIKLLMSDPKLIQARDRIRSILDELDIAGHVALHNAPGSMEIFTKLDPSYSRLVGLPPVVRFHSKLEDYQGDAEAQRRDLEATANMVSSLAEALGRNALGLIELSQTIDAKTGAKHTPLEKDD